MDHLTDVAVNFTISDVLTHYEGERRRLCVYVRVAREHTAELHELAFAVGNFDTHRAVLEVGVHIHPCRRLQIERDILIESNDFFRGNMTGYDHVIPRDGRSEGDRRNRRVVDLKAREGVDDLLFRSRHFDLVRIGHHVATVEIIERHANVGFDHARFGRRGRRGNGFGFFTHGLDPSLLFAGIFPFVENIESGSVTVFAFKARFFPFKAGFFYFKTGFLSFGNAIVFAR